MNIKDVWDYRLSTCTPLIVREGGTWVCHIFPKIDGDGAPMESYDTEIPFVPGDAHDEEKLKVCHDWFKSIRDKYSLSNIEDLKPKVAEIREKEEALAHQLNTSNLQ